MSSPPMDDLFAAPAAGIGNEGASAAPAAQSDARLLNFWMKASVDGRAAPREPVVIGRRLSPQWLSGCVSVVEVRLQGALRDELARLLDAVGEKAAKSLPMGTLRTFLTCEMPGLFRVDPRLGLPRAGGRDGVAVPALEVMGMALEEMDGVRSALRLGVLDWIQREVEAWAMRRGLGDLAGTLRAAVKEDSFSFTNEEKPLVAANGRPDFGLIVRSLAAQLTGEQLFPEMGDCELVVQSRPRDDVVELMTLPRRSDGRRAFYFSMVARLSVITVPYDNGLILRVVPSKRVWSGQIPPRRYSATREVQAYVMARGRPCLQVPMRKTAEGWSLGAEYASLAYRSRNELPASLEQVVQQLDFGEEKTWWAGVPQASILFRRLSPSTVYELDEFDLAEAVAARLGGAVEPGPIVHKPIDIRKPKAQNELTMLDPADVGYAGAIFDRLEDDDEDDAAAVTDEPVVGDAGDARDLKLNRYRSQNMRALQQIHGDKRVQLFIFSDHIKERSLAERAAKVLFGEQIEVYCELLPARTHGLQADLPEADKPSQARFDARVRAWDGVARLLKERAARVPVVAMVCVADEVGGRPEDVVNCPAGIHALCKTGSNVHYVKPIDEHDDGAKNFLHRFQSALLDVTLAHSGLVFNVGEFAQRVFEGVAPRFVFGVQAVRSNRRFGTGESDVAFLLFTRLDLSTGIVSMRCVLERGGPSKWMPLAEGLPWLGAQRSLGGDRRWVETQLTAALRTELIALNELDPQALVLVDWASVAGAWRGLRDADLTDGPGPRLGDEQMLASLFPRMTFARLRYAQALPLRVEQRRLFRGYSRESASATPRETGQVHTQHHMTSVASLVQLSPLAEAAGGMRPRAHFLATNGYRSNSHPRRGLSGYRRVHGMVPVTKKGLEYVLGVSDPWLKDDRTPSAFEITVVQCTTGTAPEKYAEFVMGLCVCFSHYNDWTRLPAPLFFKRKVEDHIVRYRDADDGIDAGDDSGGGGPGGEEPPDTDSGDDGGPAGGLLDLVSEEVAEQTGQGGQDDAGPKHTLPSTDGGAAMEPLAMSPSVAAEAPPLPAGGEVAASRSAASHEPAASVSSLVAATPVATSVPGGDSANGDGGLGVGEPVRYSIYEPGGTPEALLRAYKASTRRSIFDITDRLGRRIQARILRLDVTATIELPYWIGSDLSSVFVFNENLTRRAIDRMWDRVKHWQFVRQNQAVPSVEAFQRWFSEKLRTPQGCLALSSIAGPVGGVIFSELQAIVDREVNPSLPDDGRVDSFSVVDEETAVPLTTWAVERDHDALLAWLIFVCAQCPIGDLDAVVRERLQRVPGPRTEHALMYYLASLEAIDEIAQKALAGRFTLHKPLPRPTLVIPSAKGSLPPQVPKETAAAPADVANAFPVAAEVLSTAVHNKPDTRYGTHAAPALETVISPMDNALGAAVGEQDLVMSIKVRLVDIIQGLLPGDPEFPQALDKVQEEIRRLEEIHRQQVEERNKAAAAWAAAQEVRSLQGRLASLLRQVLPQVGSPFDFDAKEVAPADHGRATEELHAVSAAVVEALRALELEKELRRLPVPARLEDRRRRNKDCDNLLATAEEHIAHARHLMESGVAIIVVESPDAGGVGAESAPASSQVAPTASASPAAVAPSEPATTTSEPTARPTALQNAAVVTTVPVAPSTTAAEPAGAGNEVSSTTAGTDAASTVATTTAAAAASTADTVEVELQVDSQVADDALTASPTSEVTAPATVDALAPVATPAPTSVPAPVSAAALVSPPPVKTPAIAATGAVPSARPKALQQAVAATSSTPVAKAPFDLGFAVQPPPLIAPGCQSADLPVAWRNPVDRCQADHRADDG